MKGVFSERWNIILAFTAVYVVWGSTYLAIWIGLNSLPPFLMSGLRFLGAGLILQSWCSWKRESLPDKNSIFRSALCGVLMLLGGIVSVVWAEQYLSSSLAAIVVTLLPFWFILLDKKQWSFYFSNKSIIAGLLLGFAGVSILLAFSHPAVAAKQVPGNQLQGILVILCGGIAWTVGSLYSKYKPVKAPLIVNGCIQLIAAGFFCILISIGLGEWKHYSVASTTVNSWLALLYLIIMGSLVTYLAYLYLLKKRPAAQVSTYVYVNPVIAVLLGSFLANEPISGLKILALIIILIGVLLVNLPKYHFRST
jgi:drug/metabolite transporter (DMT)-like permease